MLQSDEIAFLIGDVELAQHDNHVRLPAAFRAAGWQVDLLPQESVRLEPSGVHLGSVRPDRYRLIWLLGLGRFHTFFDRMQLLRLLPQERFVTSVDALIYRHAKYAWWRYMPETHASSDLAYLTAKLAGGGDWVAKPAAGSYGRDVVRIRDDAAGRAVLERLTGDGPGDYCLLQRFVPGIADGEKRTLVAGGRIIGSYLRMPGDDLRANLAAGGTAHPTDLTGAEQALVETVAAELTAGGVGFAAVDTVFPHLMEVNLANPGGLATLASLYGDDPAAQAVDAICTWRGGQ
jgi:glutathione synthase